MSGTGPWLALAQPRGSDVAGRLGGPDSCDSASSSSSSRGDRGASRSRTSDGRSCDEVSHTDGRGGRSCYEGTRSDEGGGRACGEGSRFDGGGDGSCCGEGLLAGSREAAWFALSSSSGGTSFRSKSNGGLPCAIVSLLRRWHTRISLEKRTQK
jgi:hypothetical protein